MPTIPDNDSTRQLIEKFRAEGRAVEGPTAILPEPAQEIDEAKDEKAFMADVMKEARKRGWNLIYHTHDSRKSAKGFPDLVMIRGPRLVFAELKSQTGKVEPEQQEWLDALMAVRGPWVFLWRPSNWPEIIKVLT